MILRDTIEHRRQQQRSYIKAMKAYEAEIIRIEEEERAQVGEVPAAFGAEAFLAGGEGHYILLLFELAPRVPEAHAGAARRPT